jgi:hypothetical protein
LRRSSFYPALAKLAFPSLVALTFALGLFLRLADLANPPLDFHPTRQFFGAIRARAIYQQTAPDIPAWQRDLSARFIAREAQLEPLLLENMAAFLYRWTGEDPAVPRALSGCFWLLGGFFLFQLTRNLMVVEQSQDTESRHAALAALLFYLFLPYSVSASRSFQPDPLMVLFLLAFWWAFDHWSRRPADWRWAISAGLLGGLAIYIKLTAVFFVVGGAVGLLLAHQILVPALKRPQTWLLVALGILPGGLYVYDGLFGRGFLVNEFGRRTFISWWLTPNFYLRWLDKLDNILPLWLLPLMIVSLMVFTNRPTYRFLMTLWAAYIIFGLSQTHHIASHDYYSLPIVPITALGLASFARAVIKQILARVRTRRSQTELFLLTVLSLLLITAQDYLVLRRSDNRPLAQMYAEIGETLQHQPGVIALTQDYGYPLFYYGWQNASLWNQPSPETFEQSFETQVREKAYFLITDLDELARQPQLGAKLSEYNILAQKPGYILYDLKTPRP